ncbi:MAG: hypothetical protein INR64_19485 [Caulobacteraceae bacterium]|nr:hypothetical protein [Caulobacter sp.]
MSCKTDLTLDEALADPMIGAALRADGLDLRQFETTLRAAARRIGAERPPAALPAAALAARALRRAVGDCCAW